MMMSELVSCPSDELLAEFVDGRLPAASRPSMLAHLSRCEVCHSIVSETVAFLDEAPAPVARTRPRASLKPAWLGALAAAAAIAIVLSRSPDPAPVVGQPPKWAAGAVWQGSGGLHFAARPQQEAFRLGRRLAALDRACVSPGAEAKFIRDRVVPGAHGEAPEAWWRAASNAGACHGGRVEVAIPPVSDLAWVALGRTLERSRIAAVEQDTGAITASDRSDLAKLAAELPLEDVARRLTEELVAFLRTPANTTTPDWPTVEAKVADLIEVLES